MATLVIVGAQWGDEAKGKIVDVLAAEANLVVRYSGGNNAGHTVVVEGQEFRFHLVPAGILHPHVTAVLGGGMVICPKGLLEELESVNAQRNAIGRLCVSPAAHVVLPYHRLLDRLQEDARGPNKIGTTSRGIGPAYEDKVARIGIRIGEFVEPELFFERLGQVLEVKNRLLSLFGEPPLDFCQMHEEYAGYAQRIRPYVTDTDALVSAAVRSGERVLFEGAQGTYLDLDTGTYPYVTSSHPIAGGACLGTGIGPLDIQAVLGVCKAYTTRVGSGPFPTELRDGVGERIREQGQEYGTTTGRGRRCGWLDLVALKQSRDLNSLSALALTRLDVLSGIGELKVCTQYMLDGRRLDRLPTQIQDLARVETVLESFEGWSEDLTDCRSKEDLPAAARHYLEFIESETGLPIVMISVGPQRDQTIRVPNDLLWRGTSRNAN
jgi:adenylosuccinate synthase